MAYTNIDKPTDYFNTVTYTGNGSSGHSITGVGFQPDMTWIKIRNQAFDHALQDSVRGATKDLEPNQTSAEDTRSMLTAFASDGFTLGSDSQSNSNNNTFVAWNWLASNTTASNTDGSITSSVSANTTAGFSIVNFVGTQVNATVGHGLGSAPSMIIVKNRDNATSQWWVYHKSISPTKSLNLNTTDAEQTVSVIWNNTSTTSSVFSVGTGDEVNGSGNNIIAYCFAEKKGFSKFGSYTGNGSTDGTFVYTGFRPAFLIIKRTNASNNWHMYDNKRDTYNVADAVLYPNLSNAEGTDTTVDFLSNGFKLRTAINFANGSGDSYIYMCFAENPFVTSGGIPTTAR